MYLNKDELEIIEDIITIEQQHEMYLNAKYIPVPTPSAY